MSQKIVLGVFFLLFSGAFYPLYAAGPAMVEKDLFSMERKPPPLQSEDTYSKPGGSEMGLGNIIWDGVIIRNNNRKAILRIKNIPAGRADDAGNSVSPFIVIREGEEVKGYRVIRIKFRSVSLRRDGKTYTIDLFANHTGGAGRQDSTAARRVQPGGAGGRAGLPELPAGVPRLPPRIFPKTGFNPGKPPKTPPPPMP